MYLLCVQCGTKRVCASYESAFIRSDSLRWALFSPFQYEGLSSDRGSEGGGLELRERAPELSLDEASALLDSTAVALAEEDTVGVAVGEQVSASSTQMTPQDPAPAVDKDRVLLIRSVSSKQRFRDMQVVEVVKKKTVRRQSRWSKFWQKVGYKMRRSKFWRPVWVFLQKLKPKKRPVSSVDDEASGEPPKTEQVSPSDSLQAAELALEDSLFWADPPQTVVQDSLLPAQDSLLMAQDSLLIAQDSLLTTRDLPADSLTQEAQARYRFQYNPKDTFNVDQVFYNRLFGDLFFVKDEEMMSEGASNESAEEEKEVEAPTSYEEYLQQEEAKALGQESERETEESVGEDQKTEEEEVPSQTPTLGEEKEEEEREVPPPLLEDEGF